MYISSILGSREVPPARSRSRRMSAVLTKGRKFALVLPSTNTSVEREFHHLRPQDCSWHTGRIMIKAPALDSANAFQAFRECLNEALPSALETVLTCEPDYIVMGMSAETFWGGVQGNAAFVQGVRDLTGLEVTTGATAAGEALKACGANLECVAVAAELEKELGKPVIAINLATMWHAFRTNGIDDKIAGYGSLMELH